jgi:hypothetical protein
MNANDAIMTYCKTCLHAEVILLQFDGCERVSKPVTNVLEDKHSALSLFIHSYTSIKTLEKIALESQQRLFCENAPNRAI